LKLPGFIPESKPSLPGGEGGGIGAGLGEGEGEDGGLEPKISIGGGEGGVVSAKAADSIINETEKRDAHKNKVINLIFFIIACSPIDNINYHIYY